jgi:hypothetical protein
MLWNVSEVGAAVGDADCCTLGAIVETLEEVGVGTAEGTPEEFRVGAGVGLDVNAVGDDVGTVVDSDVEFVVGTFVGIGLGGIVDVVVGLTVGTVEFAVDVGVVDGERLGEADLVGDVVGLTVV